MDAGDATARFLSVMAGPAAAVPLDLAALLVAAHASERLDVAAELSRLDELAAGCPGRSAEELRTYLFDVLGFAGDRQHYDDPRNSMLDQVLSRRMGIPITLSVVMLEVGRRLGIPLYGVGMPGHFLVGEGEGRYIDPFEHGRVLDAEGCRRQYHAVLGTDAPWDRTFLAPVGPRTILARILANLRQLYAAADDLVSLSWVLKLRAGAPGVAPGDRMELVGVLSALGRYDEAARAVDDLVRSEPAPERADELRGRAARLRARLN